VRIAGGVSATVAPIAGDGPALVTTMAYATAWPGCTDVWPSLFVMPRSAWGMMTPEAAKAQKPECSPYVPPAAGPPASGWPIVPERPNDPPAVFIAPPPSTVYQDAS
jgi:hypothetical protein